MALTLAKSKKKKAGVLTLKKANKKSTAKKKVIDEEVTRHYIETAEEVIEFEDKIKKLEDKIAKKLAPYTKSLGIDKIEKEIEELRDQISAKGDQEEEIFENVIEQLDAGYASDSWGLTTRVGRASTKYKDAFEEACPEKKLRKEIKEKHTSSKMKKVLIFKNEEVHEVTD